MDIFAIKINDLESLNKEALKQFEKKVIKDEKKRLIHCLTYFMLDKILKDVYKIQDSEVVYENNKPVLKNWIKKISISHSENFIALAFSDYDCGIDIEKIKERDYEKIAERMKFNCKNEIEFYQEWTKFEAEYKLGQRPNSLKFCKIDDYILCVVSINNKEEFNLYTLSA